MWKGNQEVSLRLRVSTYRWRYVHYLPFIIIDNQFVFDEVKYNFTWAMYDGEEDDEEQLEIK